MNKYQEFVSLVKKHKLTIKTRENHDARSGWTGKNVEVYDRDEMIFDLSGNGFCFEDYQVELAIDAIKSHFELKKINNFEAFKKYIYEMAEEVK